MKRLAGLAIALCLAAAPARADERLQLVEQDIKAGLLYNFVRYTQWPAQRVSQDNAPTILCVYGDDPFGGRLAPLSGRTVNQRAIEVRTVRSTAEIGACWLLFVNRQEKSLWPELKTYLAGKDVLTVSDYSGFAASGGMIEFTRIDNRIGMNLNVDAVASAHLTVQDRLLKLAKVVRTRPAAP